MKTVRKAVTALCLSILCCMTPAMGLSQDITPAREPGYFAVDAGLFSVLDLWALTGFVSLRVEPPVKCWILKPQAGVLASFSGSVMAWGGLVWPATPVKWLVIETGAAAGYYYSGNGIDLGYPLEFRISLSVCYRFRNDAGIGLLFAHMSNANLSADNPGTESLSVVYRLPVWLRK